MSTTIFGTAVHEAGHAVILLRLGGKIERIWLNDPEKIFGVGGRCNPVVDTRASVATSDKQFRAIYSPLFAVDGHFAELRWGGGGALGSFFNGASGDFDSLARAARDSRALAMGHDFIRRGPRTNKADKAVARKVWAKAMRELGRMAKKDPTIQRDVLAVAAALVEKMSLTGAQIDAIIQQQGDMVDVYSTSGSSPGQRPAYSLACTAPQNFIEANATGAKCVRSGAKARKDTNQ